MTLIKFIAGVAIAVALGACGGGGGSPGANSNSSPTSSVGTTAPTGTTTLPLTPAPTTPVTSTPTAVSLVASLSILSSSNQIRSDGTSTTTIVVNAIDASNGLLRDVPIVIRATSGVISSSSGTTDANGQVAVTFNSGVNDRSNRIATITATSNGKSAQTQVKIVGGTVTLDAGGLNALVVGGGAATLTAIVRDATGVPASSVTVTFESSNPSAVAVASRSITTDGAGFATVSVSAVSAGRANISASANGITEIFGFTSSLGSSGFFISSPVNGLAIPTGTTQTLTVVATGVNDVTFVTPVGTFANGTAIQNVPVVAGLATVAFMSSTAGNANISVFDPTAPSIRTANISIIVSPPVSSANKILLSANKTNVSISTASTQNAIQIKARALFNIGGTDVGVFNVPILFSVVGGPGAGEALSQAIAFTDASGNASTNFIAGTQATTQNGLTVTAQILGTTVRSGTLPSNSDLVLTIGGQALSVLFTPGTKIIPSADNTYYELPLSAQVTDANGNAVANELVSLSVEPFAYSTGFDACAGPNTRTFSVNGRNRLMFETYCSEDANNNGSLDNSEDGGRILYDPLSKTCLPEVDVFRSVFDPLAAPRNATKDGLLTPPNSAAGSVPSTITTNSAGIAGFNLTYLKGSAVWVVVKLTATVGSAGTESSFSTKFRLSPSAEDGSANPCPLPPSPYGF